MQIQDMNLVLSTDAKPRLKWTPELHQRFVDAIIHLGGTDKATPKSLMRVMGIPGLTLYHLKSHLQKYRLGKNHPIESSGDSKKEGCQADQGELDVFSNRTSQESESLHVSRAIQVQVEVQRKLYEQIEVQRHLQLRIEAQGKYLQEVLKKAQETLSAYTSSSSMGGEHAKVELSQLVSMVNSGCASPSLSELTEARALSLENLDSQIGTKRHGCSTESSLTSSENSGLNDRVLGKRKGIPASEAAAQLSSSKIGVLGRLDLNSQYQYQDTNDLGQSTSLDLNSIGME